MNPNPFTLLKRTPVKKRRSKLRRGRVVDVPYLRWMHTHGCLVEGKRSPCIGTITVHHFREFGNPKNDRRTLTLCQGHHQEAFGPDSIERLGKAKWQAKFGINIQLEIARYNEAYVIETQMVSPVPKPDEPAYKHEAGVTRERMEWKELYG
jgi:hypothetical protein